MLHVEWGPQSWEARRNSCLGRESQGPPSENYFFSLSLAFFSFVFFLQVFFLSCFFLSKFLFLSLQVKYATHKPWQIVYNFEDELVIR